LSTKVALIVQKHAKWKLVPFNKKLFVSGISVIVRIVLRQKMLKRRLVVQNLKMA